MIFTATTGELYHHLMRIAHSPALIDVPRPGMGAQYVWRPIVDNPRSVVRRGALAAAGEPTEIIRHGCPIDLSQAEATIVSILIRRGHTSYADLHAILATGPAKATLEVFVHRIRRKFAAHGAPDPIKTVRNWGLSLRIEPDQYGSTALWIGDVIA